MEAEKTIISCIACNFTEFEKADGFYYCLRCGTQVEDIIDTAIADEDLVKLYFPCFQRRPPSTSQDQPPPQKPIFNVIETPHIEPEKRVPDSPEPTFGGFPGNSSNSRRADLSYENYYTEVRMRYVLGLQNMIQPQCKTPVEEFQVTPLIVGVISSIWLRYVAYTGVLKEGWADKVIQASEQMEDGKFESKPSSSRGTEPCNLYGQRATLIWLRSLRKTIPTSYTLAFTFLFCHVSREAVLPTDIIKWALEGKLPYLKFFNVVSDFIGNPSEACPLRSKDMFKPQEIPDIESVAASIASSIGLDLPPVNFYSISCRYLGMLALPAVPKKRILQGVCRIHGLSQPPESCLSKNGNDLPSRAGVMSMVVVAIRILYGINGSGVWEESLQDSNGDSSLPLGQKRKRTTIKSKGEASGSKNSDMDASDLLKHLEAMYNKLDGDLDLAYTKDLDSYLRYCKDVIFCDEGQEGFCMEEMEICKELWEAYENRKDKQPIAGINYTSEPVESTKERVIRKMKLCMEEEKFTYIPLRSNIKNQDYIHYVRKKDGGGNYGYFADSDYYILLRARAKVAQVDVRTMHDGVLRLEKSLEETQKKIDEEISKFKSGLSMMRKWSEHGFVFCH